MPGADRRRGDLVLGPAGAPVPGAGRRHPPRGWQGARNEHAARHDPLTGLPNRTAFRETVEDTLKSDANLPVCCSSTSTASRRSTTRSAIDTATCSCSRSRSVSGSNSARRPDRAARRRRVRDLQPRPRPRRDAGSGADDPRPRCGAPSSSSTSRSTRRPASASRSTPRTAPTSRRWCSRPTSRCTSPRAAHVGFDSVRRAPRPQQPAPAGADGGAAHRGRDRGPDRLSTSRCWTCTPATSWRRGARSLAAPRARAAAPGVVPRDRRADQPDQAADPARARHSARPGARSGASRTSTSSSRSTSSARVPGRRELPAAGRRARCATPASRPNRLELEITESTLIADPVTRARGAARARPPRHRDLDRRLRDRLLVARPTSPTCPCREIKIDQSFVSRMAAGSSETIIVSSTIDLAHHLGLRVDRRRRRGRHAAARAQGARLRRRSGLRDLKAAGRRRRDSVAERPQPADRGRARPEVRGMILFGLAALCLISVPLTGGKLSPSRQAAAAVAVDGAAGARASGRDHRDRA